MAAERSRTCLNYALTEPGTLRVRPGWTAFSSHSLGSSGGQGGARVYLASTQFTLLAGAAGVYKPTDTGGLSTTPVLTGLTAATRWRSATTGTSSACSIRPRRRRSPRTARTGRGSGSPSARSSPRSRSRRAAPGRSSTSEFEVSYAYKDRGLVYESNGSTAVSTITVTDSTNDAITVNVPNTTDPQVDAIVIYARNVTAGESVLRRVSSLAQSTGARSTYVITSSVLECE